MRIVVRSILFVLAVSSLRAQGNARDAHTTGFFMFLGADFPSFRADSITHGRESANGYMLGLGFGLTERFALVMHGGSDWYRHGASDQFEYALFEGGARYHFPIGETRWVPYVDATLDWNIVRRDTAIGPDIGGAKETTGSTYGGGVGVMFHLTPSWSLDVEALASAGDFRTVTAADRQKVVRKFGTNRMALTAGLALYPDHIPLPKQRRRGG